MKYAFFVGCKTPFHVPAYEAATRAVCGDLGVQLVDMEFTCCGYPMRNLYFESYLLSAARAMAMAEGQGLHIMTQCKCCLGSFKTAAYYMQEDPAMWEKVNASLAEEGLEYTGRSTVKHLLTVLHNDVGLKALSRRITRPFHDLRVAVLHGCHALRPSQMTNFDDPWHPRISDRLVEVTGAEVVDWAGKISCCGAPLRGRDDKLSMAMIHQRLSEARQAHADVFCVSCPYSHMQATAAYAGAEAVPARWVSGAVLYPQLLGLAMGLDAADLGISDGPADGGLLLSHRSRGAA